MKTIQTKCLMVNLNFGEIINNLIFVTLLNIKSEACHLSLRVHNVARQNAKGAILLKFKP